MHLRRHPSIHTHRCTTLGDYYEHHLCGGDENVSNWIVAVKLKNTKIPLFCFYFDFVCGFLWKVKKRLTVWWVSGNSQGNKGSGEVDGVCNLRHCRVEQVAYFAFWVLCWNSETKMLSENDFPHKNDVTSFLYVHWGVGLSHIIHNSYANVLELVKK
jgi:hypothetical protein